MTTESPSTVSNLEDDPISARALAEALYRGEGLELPHVPASLASKWRQVGPTAFASAPLGRDLTLYSIESVLGAILSGKLPTPFVAFGFDGHGIASQAVHAYYATAQAVVLIQFRWGTIFDEPDMERKRYHLLMKWGRQLDEVATAAAASGAFPKDQRLVVVQSSFTGSRWAWTSPSTAIEWRRSDNLALLEAIVALRKLGS